MVRIAIKTTGCKVNQADGDRIREALADLPVRFVAPDGQADIVVVNACAVTAAAERDGRAAIHRAIREGRTTLLAGCMAARIARTEGPSGLPDDLRRFPGTRDRAELVAYLRAEVERLAGHAATRADGPPEVRRERARPFVKVQDGCDCDCSYCVVPLVRGPSRSEPTERVLDAVATAARAGAAEVVLTGIDLAAWGRDLAGTPDLAYLLRTVSALGTGLRFRLSSVEPHGLTDGLLDAMAGLDDVCPHLHLPLQSGSDPVLAAMGRPYRAKELADRVRHAATCLPGVAVGYDVIVGFPGETEDDFERTRALLEALPLTYLHVFPFSPRPGTVAAAMADDVPRAVKARRGRALRDLSAARRVERAVALVGADVEVVDIRCRAGRVESLAGDYTRVSRVASTARPGRFRVRIATSDGPTAIAADED